MATRSRTSLKKRQKELARAEKQRDKAAKRLERKNADPSLEPTDGDEDTSGFDLDAELDAANAAAGRTEPRLADLLGPSFTPRSE